MLNIAFADFASCLADNSDGATTTVCTQWNLASSTGLANTAISNLSDALWAVMVIIIPVAVAIGIFFFVYNMARGIFRNRR